MKNILCEFCVNIKIHDTINLMKKIYVKGEKPYMLKAIIFDLDDTLLWDDRSVNEALTATCDFAAQKCDIKSTELEKIIREKAPEIYASFDTIGYVKDIGIGYFEALWGDFNVEGEQQEKVRQMALIYRFKVWQNGLSELGVEDQTLVKTLAEKFKEERKSRIYLYEETLNVLEELKDKYKIILLTNGSPDLQRTKLSLSPELEPYLADIVISGDFGSGKPDPAIFNYILKKNDLRKDEAIMVGDNILTDILGASKIDMNSVWINHNQVEPQGVKPTFEISRLKEVLPIIKELSE